MLRMLDRHAVQEMRRAGVSARAIAGQLGVSVRTVRRIGREAPVVESADASSRTARGVGRPGVDAPVRERIAVLVAADPEAPPGEILRRLHEEGTPLGQSTLYRLLAQVRPTLAAQLQVRFEGVAGEFAQFDFGEVSVRLREGARRTVHFAAYRLKYSRWVHVVLVANERVEALVRSLLASFAAAGGVPLRVVFDNPKTVVLRHEEGRPVWNATLAQSAVDYGFTIELCTPHQPQQRGAVENLVGFVKRRFFRARVFQDLEQDLPSQLTTWLSEVNTVRPSRATREIPAQRLGAEQARMKLGAGGSTRRFATTRLSTDIGKTRSAASRPSPSPRQTPRPRTLCYFRLRRASSRSRRPALGTEIPTAPRQPRWSRSSALSFSLPRAHSWVRAPTGERDREAGELSHLAAFRSRRICWGGGTTGRPSSSLVTATSRRRWCTRMC
jgi:transposase